MADVDAFELSRDGVRLAGESAGEGPPIVLLHGLTATRRYVVMGSKKLGRSGYRVIGYDARGHGESSPAPEPARYEYSDQVADLEAVLDHFELERAVLAGNSMGATTAMALAIEKPERVSALVQITPAYMQPRSEPAELAAWERLADGLESGGVEGFIEAWEPEVNPQWLESALAVARQRLGRHRHLEAVADALRVVPRSRAWDGIEDLEWVELPTLVVGSRDEADPGHPLSVAEAYAARLPDAKLIVEQEGKSPLAWQGAQLSAKIDEFLRERLS
jgi:pimeloyl-ACP methyl ester carboxylesterase